jgi:hypothetical protein
MRLITFAATLILLGGCQAVSLGPICTPESVLACPHLEGVWRSSENDGTDREFVTIKPKDGRSYGVTPTDGDPPGALTEECRDRLVELQAVTTNLGGRWFIDVTYAPKDDDESGAYVVLMTAQIHCFYRITMACDDLAVDEMNASWLTGWVKGHPSQLQLFEGNEGSNAGQFSGRTLIISPTPRLQEFLGVHASDETAWTPHKRFHRYQSLVGE